MATNNSILKMKAKKIKTGYVMLLTTIIFMMFSIIIILGISTLTIKQVFLSRDIWSSKQSYYLSEAGAEDVAYRLKYSIFGSKLESIETLSLNNYEAVTRIASSYSEKTITSLSDQDGYKKSIEMKFIQGSGISFNYGILSGNGGFVITGGSNIVGNVYSNGNILGGSGVHITGSAIAASGGTILKDEANEMPTPNPNSITFNNAYASRDFAQSFKPSTTLAIQKIKIYIKKTNSPSDFVVNLMSDVSGNPGSVLATSVLNAGDVTTNFGWTDLIFTQNVVLTKDTTYWFVINGIVKNGKTSIDTYTIGANNIYSKGVAKTGVSGGSWNNTNLDGYFSTYFGSVPSKIYGNEGDYMYIGSTSTDVAWASDVSHVNLTGNLYCDSGTNNANGIICNTSKSLPDTLAIPISGANIDQWKSEFATGGTYSGDFLVDWRGGIVGARKITGDLIVNGGGTLMVTGTIWVQGNIVLTGGGKIKLSPSLGSNSAIILTDGYVNIDGGGQFEGSGISGSYPIVVSTSICPKVSPCATNNSAISLSGGAGAVVLAAPYGKVNINGGSGARSITGDSIYISGGGTVTYESGLANISFASGPSGGWKISGWEELEN